MENQQQKGLYRPLMVDPSVPTPYGGQPGWAPQGQQFIQDNGSSHNGLQRLSHLPGVFIKQKMTMGQFIPCASGNAFKVYPLEESHGNKKGHALMKCKENSEFCARACLSTACRPFQMDVISVQEGAEDETPNFVLSLDKPCKWTFMCFDRPELLVTTFVSGKREHVGKIVHQFACCDVILAIYDKNDVKKFSISGSCTQLGFICPCPCEPCQTLDFDIFSASGEAVGHLQRRSQGCIRASATDLDSYALNFPQNSTLEDKVLLMSAVILLDYTTFGMKGKHGDDDPF